MKQTLLVIILLISLCSPQAFAQSKRANIWYFGKKGLDFNQSPPKILNDGAFWDNRFNNTSMADEEGNLLFYGTGEKIWNKNHQVMVNGDGLAGHYASAQGIIAVPKPGSKTHYYVFTSDARENGWRNGLRYSIVDISKQAGLGEVVNKNVLLLEKAEENLAVTGHCNCSTGDKYWLASDKLDRPGYIYTFLIDKAGISTKPVESFLPGVSRIEFLRFSPDGNKIAFLGAAANEQLVTGIADFDFKTGTISAVKLIPPFAGNSLQLSYAHSIEFSGKGRYVYVGYDQHFGGGTTFAI
jgi:hypothetical protein